MTPTEAKNPVVDVFLSPDSNDFCVTTEEMKMFMVIETADVDHISAKYCEPTLTDKLCKKPAAGCVEIIGDVEIKSGFNTDLMKNVEAIYGSLIIKATTLTNFGFLEKLKYVATLEHKPAISIEDNKNLTNVDFPSLKRIRSDSTNTIEFKYNNRALSADPSICFGVRKALNLSDWAPTFDDFSCEILETQAKAEAAKKSSIVWNGLISVVSLVFIL
uniref:Recep_L_domain domain-containing protein n=1 Tax=Caenorhabditis tropicalis TaxID=1561998 RepID=A0A1I7T7M6_9PELO